MVVEFTLEFNVQVSDYFDYQDFIRSLRRRLGVRSSHNLPALAVQQNPPTRFFDLVLRTNNHGVRFRFRMDNLYLIGYQMENSQWLEFDNWVSTKEEEEKKKKKKEKKEEKKLVHLITEPGTAFLGFEGNYDSLPVNSTSVGFHSLVTAINQLAETRDSQARENSLVVVIMMICESARFIPVFDYMAQSFARYPSSSTTTTTSQIPTWIINLVKKWEPLSAALLCADAWPGQRFLCFPESGNRADDIIIQPNGRTIRTIADVVAILGILLGICFNPDGSKRVRRMIRDEGQCFLGVPLVEVFSVQINNIDGEDPGELYGTITISNGLYTQYIYNRTRDNYEFIKPGQNASLTGPSRPVSAFGNVTIKLLLTDKDIISWDDVIMDQVISWHSANIGDVSDELIPRQLDSKLGSVTVNYAVLRNAAAARVTVTIQEGGEATTEIYGHVSACYGNWAYHEMTFLLFDRTSDNYVEVNRWQTIPLLRSVAAVPLNDSLKVTASLKDYDPISDDVIANGTVEIFVPKTLPFTTFNRIDGEDGNYVTVTVYWSSGF